jgi:hypothetical protein
MVFLPDSSYDTEVIFGIPKSDGFAMVSDALESMVGFDWDFFDVNVSWLSINEPAEAKQRRFYDRHLRTS